VSRQRRRGRSGQRRVAQPGRVGRCGS
jgi:hypothetical protein